MSPISPYVTVTVTHAEYVDVNQGGNSAKFYRTYVCADGRVLYQYGRIGTVGQWVEKGNQGATAANVAALQLQSKLNKGYDYGWKKELRVPTEWMDMVAGPHRTLLADSATSGSTGAFIEHRERPSTDEPTDLDQLEVFAGRLRGIVAQMATDPDNATIAYAQAVPEYEAIKESLDLVDNYMDAIQQMLVAGAA